VDRVGGRPTIGVLSTSFGGWYFGSILAGIARSTMSVDGRMVAVQTLDAGTFLVDLAEPPDFRHQVAWDHISGFVVLLNAVDRTYLEAIRAAGKPVVGISHREPGFGYPVVLPDNRAGARAAVEHLIQHGHTRVAFAGFIGQRDINERYVTYLEAMRAHGIEPDPALFYDTTNNQVSGGELAARRMIADGVPSTAVVAGNDANATGILTILRAAGLDLPRDQAVIGFDDVDVAVHLEPSLSTVRQGLDLIGSRATELILAEMTGGTVPHVDHPTPATFVARESCGCPSTLALSTGSSTGAVTVASRRQLVARLREVLGPAGSDADTPILSTVVHTVLRSMRAAADGESDPHPDELRRALAGLRRLFPLPEVRAEVQRCLKQHGRHLTEALLAGNEVRGALHLEDRIQDIIQGLSQANERADFIQSTIFQSTYTSQHEVSMDLLRSHEESPRTLSWLAGTRASSGRLGLWSPDGTALDIVGAFDADRPQRQAEPTRTTVRAFPPVELVERADLKHDNMVFVALAKVNRSDRGMLAVAGPIEATVPTGREMMNQWAALLTIALDHESAVESLREQEERMRHAALYDELTGLANRTLFVDRLTQAIARTNRTGNAFAVLLLDLDGFKRVNDSLGHLVGDQLLVEAGWRLRGVLRDNDVAARLGGDEFVILLEDVTDAQGPAAVADRLHRALQKPCILGGQQVVVSASIGIAHSGAGYDKPEDIIRDADIAMYSAKSREKGTHAEFDVRMHQQAVRRLTVEAELRRGLDRGELELHYQPIVDLDSGRTAKLEALIRWRHPERGLVAPGEFLPVAEDSGLMPAIGGWVMREACHQLARWHRTLAGPRLDMSVNVSNRQFWHGHLTRDIEQCLASAGLQPRHLAVEITEGVIMHDIRLAQRQLDELHELGVELHIDDFGTGYSSLDVLHQLPIDVLKIDRSFVARVGSGPKSRELVRTIVTMGNNLGMALIAEGIETAEQEAEVRALGCAYGQGYRLCRPLPSVEIEAYLATGRPAG
jgi:diguanylate cyclase (GGDEF)-like protein